MPEPATPPPPSAPSRRSDAFRLMASLWDLGRSLTDHLDPLLQAQHDLDRRDYMALATVAKGTLSPSELAATLRMPRDMTSRTIARLRRAGLLTRSADDADGRRAHLSLTPLGTERRAAVRSVLEATVETALGKLGDPERDQLLTSLERLNELLTAEFGAPTPTPDPAATLAPQENP